MEVANAPQADITKQIFSCVEMRIAVLVRGLAQGRRAGWSRPIVAFTRAAGGEPRVTPSKAEPARAWPAQQVTAMERL